MKNLTHTLFRIAVALFLLTILSGCGSTRTQDGVSIEKRANYNILDYIPFF